MANSADADGVRLERLQPGQWQRLRRVRLAALQDSPDAFATTWQEASRQQEADWRDALATLPTFVAVAGGEDCGMVRIALDDEAAGDAWLLSMWVAPAARRLSVGARLVQAAIEAARDLGARRLLLEVADDNAPAIALYARQGFEPTGRRGHLPAPRQQVLEHERALALD